MWALRLCCCNCGSRNDNGEINGWAVLENQPCGRGSDSDCSLGGIVMELDRFFFFFVMGWLCARDIKVGYGGGMSGRCVVLM